MGDFIEYKRPFIVLLLFSVLILIVVNYGADIFKYENFVDAPYTCNTGATDLTKCLNVGGFWKANGNRPAGCDPACACCVQNPSFTTSAQYPISACKPSAESYTEDEAKRAYSNSYLPSSDISRSKDGTLTSDALKIHIENLIKTNKLIAAPATSADAQTIYEYLKADEAAIQEMQTEFCYYSVRYTYAITKIIQAVAANVSGSSAKEGATWLAAARMLNARILDLLSIMKYLTILRLKYSEDASAIQRNADLTIRIKALSDQSNDLAGPNANTELYKKMVEYTKQKGKANGNLVLLYTFMNLIALGMLFYIYSAT